MAGDPPHSASTAQAIIAKVLTEKPQSVRISRPNVSPAVDYAIGRALEKLAADRFAITVTATGSSDILVYNIPGHTFERLTTEGMNVRPEWTPDGNKVVFRSERAGKVGIWWQPVKRNCSTAIRTGRSSPWL